MVSLLVPALSEDTRCRLSPFHHWVLRCSDGRKFRQGSNNFFHENLFPPFPRRIFRGQRKYHQVWRVWNSGNRLSISYSLSRQSDRWESTWNEKTVARIAHTSLYTKVVISHSESLLKWSVECVWIIFESIHLFAYPAWRRSFILSAT